MTPPGNHDARIQEQFSRQSATFAQVAAHASDASLAALLELAAPTPADVALDLACGPGIVTTALAPHVASARGQDVVPAMIERARARQAELGLGNVSFDVSDASRLPYADASFDLVVTRFSFHHLSEPLATLAEMRRVCKPGGRIVVSDVAPTPSTSAAYDAFETIRDPSHTHALTEPEFEALFARAGLPLVARARHGLEMALETQLAASFPREGGKDELRRLFRADVGQNRLGVNARLEGDAVHFTYPVLVLKSVRPADPGPLPP